MRKLSLLATAVLLPLAAMADPWGSQALGDAVMALLVSGFTALWMLVYLIVMLTTKRSMPIYFAFSVAFTLINWYTIYAAYQSNYHEKADIFSAYFVLSIFYVFVLYIGILNIRKPTEVG